MLEHRLGPRRDAERGLGDHGGSQLELTPNFMLIILTYAFAAAVLGGIDSPVGAVVGGVHHRGRDQPALGLRLVVPRHASCSCRSRSRC